MKQKLLFSSLFLVLSMTYAPNARAVATWYVNGVNGSNTNDCRSSLTACKTIGRAISHAASGDSIMVAAGVYKEHLTIGISLKVIGSGAGTTIVSGGLAGRVFAIFNSGASVTLSRMAIRDGFVGGGQALGGGIGNSGTLTINNCTIAYNQVKGKFGSFGAGIFNSGSLTINNSTVMQNRINGGVSGGGGIYSTGRLTINNSTLTGNSASIGGGVEGAFTGTVTINKSTLSANTAYYHGGGVYGGDPLVIINSTLSGNTAGRNGGGVNSGLLSVSSTTLSGNSATQGGNIFSNGSTTTVQNSIVANSPKGGNCSGVITSLGYNLSSDGTCNFSNSGDRNNINPKLGTLGNYGGPTQTIPLLSGSPAIDAGNPSGCTDSQGHLLKTDQRGQPRPNQEDTGGCDMGAYEKQSD